MTQSLKFESIDDVRAYADARSGGDKAFKDKGAPEQAYTNVVGLCDFHRSLIALKQACIEMANGCHGRVKEAAYRNVAAHIVLKEKL